MEWGINFTAWPEMLAWPYLILKGWLPYRDIAVAHNPFLIFILAIFYKIFGVGIWQIKIFTWLLISLNVYLVYFVLKKFYDKKVAYLSAIIYFLLTIVYEGNGLWFDLALVPFALLLYLFIREKKYLLAGVIFALGFLTKQTFVYFAIPIVIAIVQSTEYKVQRIKQFIFGLATIFLIFALYLFTNNLISSYYNWAIKFGIFYLPNAAGQMSLPNLKQLAFAFVPFLVAVLSTCLAGRQAEYLVLSFMVVGMLGVYPRFELFHFQPALPFLSIVLATFVYSKRNIFLKVIVIVCGVLYTVYGVGRQLGNTTRFYESDVQRVATQLTVHGSPSSIYVVNYWDNIYALTNTTPNKPLIPYIPWYLDYGESKNIILSNLKSKMPDSVVIGQRDKIFPELYLYVDKYYSCHKIEKSVELCDKNI